MTIRDIFIVSTARTAIGTFGGSLKEALEELDKGRAFLTKGGVFSDDFIDAYIALKSEEEIKVRTFVHPLEYELYYSC